MKLAVVLALVGCGRIDFEATPDGASAVDPSLLYWYEMNDTAITHAHDSSRYHRDASCVPPCPLLVNGVRGGGFYFNGVGDALAIPFDTDSMRDSGTIAMWARLDNMPTTNRHLIAKPFGPTNNDSWEVFVTSTGTLYFGQDAATPVASTNFDFLPHIGVWTHVAATWSTGGTLELYIDGVHEGGAGFVTAFDSHPIMIGADNDFAMVIDFWDGALDDVRIYDRVLSPTEIAALAN